MLALIYPAMLNKQALHFEGAVSEELLFKMRFDVMPLLAARDSRLTPVPLTAARRPGYVQFGSAKGKQEPNGQRVTQHSDIVLNLSCRLWICERVFRHVFGQFGLICCFGFEAL